MIDLIIGSDRRGYELKDHITNYLTPIDKDIKFNISTFLDVGPYDPNQKVDYPNIVRAITKELETPISSESEGPNTAVGFMTESLKSTLLFFI